MSILYYFKVAFHPNLINRTLIEAWLKKRVSFICPVTMFDAIVFYACHIYVKLHAIFNQLAAVLIFFYLNGIRILYLDSSA